MSVTAAFHVIDLNEEILPVYVSTEGCLVQGKVNSSVLIEVDTSGFPMVEQSILIGVQMTAADDNIVGIGDGKEHHLVISTLLCTRIAVIVR